jgi:hypothetical protein
VLHAHKQIKLGFYILPESSEREDI